MTNILKKIKEVFSERELLLILAKRDISVRYKQTILGLAWAVVKPVVTMLVFIFAYQQVAKVNSFSGYPIQLIVFSGILFWNYFANSFQAICNSILVNSNLVSKVYFPRLIICISSMAVPLVDFFVGLIVYVVLSMALDYPVSNYIFLFPIVLLLISIFSLGIGLIFVSFSVKFRDVLQITPLIVQYGFFITPIVYTTNELISKIWFTYYNIVNPLSSMVEFFRYTLLDDYSLFNFNHLILSTATSFVILIIGIIIFNKRESSFVDHL
jgi:lipopolysaccharide transport system permease protein